MTINHLNFQPPASNFFLPSSMSLASSHEPSSLASSLRYSHNSSDLSSQEVSRTFLTATSHPCPNQASDCHCGTRTELETLRTQLIRIEEDFTDSLNLLTDRINSIEIIFSSMVDDLRTERKVGHDTLRRTLSEVASRLIAFIRQSLNGYSLIRAHRPVQSRMRMDQTPKLIAAIRE